MGTVAQGFAFGTGSAVAHQAVSGKNAGFRRRPSMHKTDRDPARRRQAVGAASDAMFGGSSSAPADAPAAATQMAPSSSEVCEVGARAEYRLPFDPRRPATDP